MLENAAQEYSPSASEILGDQALIAKCCRNIEFIIIGFGIEAYFAKTISKIGFILVLVPTISVLSWFFFV